MAIIRTTAQSFNGYRASLLFRNGVAKTDDEYLIAWFKDHGYSVEDELPITEADVRALGMPTVDKMQSDDFDFDRYDVEELRLIARTYGLNPKNLKRKDALIELLKEGLDTTQLKQLPAKE